MKKALSVFLTAALAFGAFADEPVADVNIAEFSGNAAVQWGVDLDSMKTGFKNSYEVNLKLNLLNNGTKSTTGDGVWGELVLKTDDDTFIGWENGDDSDEMADELINANTGMMKYENGNIKEAFALKVYVDTAKIHIGPAYVGIKRGNTQTGELKMDAAIRSADDDQGKWLEDVGPGNFNHGIVLGVDTDIVKVDFDLRSYAIGAAATAGGYNVSGTNQKPADQYTNAYAGALEAELKGDGIGVDGLSVKAGVSGNFSEKFFNRDQRTLTTNEQLVANTEYKIGRNDGFDYMIGYSASAGYKLGLNDTFFLRPQLGFTGTTKWLTTEDGNTKTETTAIGTTMAAGLLFGWGEIGQDKNAGVWYLDDDMAKKVSPGVGVVAYIPFAGKSDVKTTVGGSTSTASNKIHGRYSARIMPSFYSGELIPGLTAAAYGDILIMDEDGAAKTGTTRTSNTDAAMAFAVGAQYALPVGEMTITPKLGLRFANASYADNYSSFGEKDDGVFGKDSAVDMGAQTVKVDDTATTDVNEAGWYDGNFMNMKLGVDVGGLVDNTTLSVIWETANLLNKSEADKAPKLGTLNFKAKISL